MPKSARLAPQCMQAVAAGLLLHEDLESLPRSSHSTHDAAVRQCLEQHPARLVEQPGMEAAQCLRTQRFSSRPACMATNPESFSFSIPAKSNMFSHPRWVDARTLGQLGLRATRIAALLP